MEITNDSQTDYSAFYNPKLTEQFAFTPNQSGMDIANSENYTILSKMNQQNKFKKNSWFRRTFGPVNRGSLRGGIINLIQAALGAGCLSLPYVYRQSGLIVGMLLTIFCGILTDISMKFLILASQSTNTNRYSAVMRACFGKKSSLVLMTVMFVYTLGIMISYYILISTMVTQVVLKFTAVDEDTLRTIIILVVAVVIFPLSAKRDLSSLNYVSLIGILAIFYIVIVILIQTPFYLTDYHPKHNLQTEYFKINMNFLISFTLNLYSYTCSQCLFEIHSEITEPTLRRAYKIIDRSIIIETSVYLVLGLTAYISTLSNTPDVVLTRDTVDGNTDYSLLIAQITMSLNLFFSIPLNLNPGRATFSMLLYKKEYKNKKTHLLITVFYLLLPATISIIFPKIVVAISFLGGTCSILLGVTFPFACYIKTNKYAKYSAINISLFGFNVIITSFSFMCAFVALFNGLGALDLPPP